MNTGKIPPQDVKVEQAVLCSFMIDASSLEFISMLKPEIFYKNEHNIIFSAIYDLFTNNKNIDLLTVVRKLTEMKQIDIVGGQYYISELTQIVSIGCNAEEYCHILIEKYVQRLAIEETAKIQSMAYDDQQLDDMIDLIDSLGSKINEQFTGDIDVSKMDELAKDCYMKLEERQKNYKENITSGIYIPIFELNRVLGGWQPSDLIYIAARPSMGKTAFALHCAKHTARKGFRTLFFSLEMSKRQLTDRLVCSEIKADPDKWRNGNIDDAVWVDFDHAYNYISGLPLWIIDKSAIKTSQIKSICKKLKPQIIFIDYIQLMTPEIKAQNRNLEMGDISHKLKSIAKDFDIPVVALCQLNRSVETRGNKIPILSDLRDSGEIEQDADVVIFPFRPYVYDKTEPDNLIFFDIKKHRNGRLATIEAEHNEYINDFFDKKPENKPF